MNQASLQRTLGLGGATLLGLGSILGTGVFVRIVMIGGGLLWRVVAQKLWSLP